MRPFISIAGLLIVHNKFTKLVLIGFVSDANLNDNCGPMLVKIVQNTSSLESALVPIGS